MKTRIVLLKIVIIFIVEGECVWSPPCPHECSCQELPMSSIVDALSPDDDGKHPFLDNILRSVICVQQHDTDAETLLARLPPQTEAIKIIQAPDAPHIQLGSTHFLHFNNLRALSLEGAEGHNGSLPAVCLHSESLGTTVALEYLSLKNLELSDAPWHPSVDSDESAEASVDENNGIWMNLTFERPAVQESVDIEIVPYEIYHMQKFNNSTQDKLWDGFVKLTQLKYLIISGCILPEGLTNSKQSASLSSLMHLKVLTIESSQLRTNPSFSQGDLPELEILSLADNSILQLQREELRGLTHVRFLDLSRNNLSRLMERSFPELPRLESIDLRANPLQVIYANAFAGLSTVKFIQIGNWDTSATGKSDPVSIHPRSLDGLSQLQSLRMGPIALITQGLSRQFFHGVTSLKQLHIRGILKSIEADTFIDNRRMQTLDLSNCHLTHLSMDALQGLNKLRLLDLSHNQLYEILPGLFDPLHSLKELWLNGNQLMTLPSSIFKPILSVAKLIRLEDNPWHCTCQLNQLRPTSVNKMKQTLPLSSDRSSVFVYDQRVTPRCQTPPQAQGYAVFDVLRRQLKCNKKKQLQAASIRNHKRRAVEEWENYRILPQQDDVDHGLAADADDIQSDPVEHVEVVDQQPPLDYSDVIDHGPEILEDAESLQNEVAIASKMEAPAALPNLKQQFYSPSLSNKSLKLLNEQLNDNIQPSIPQVKNRFYSPTLSKKSLKLLKEQQRQQRKQV